MRDYRILEVDKNEFLIQMNFWKDAKIIWLTACRSDDERGFTFVENPNNMDCIFDNIDNCHFIGNHLLQIFEDVPFYKIHISKKIKHLKTKP